MLFRANTKYNELLDKEYDQFFLIGVIDALAERLSGQDCSGLSTNLGRNAVLQYENGYKYCCEELSKGGDASG